MTPEQWKLVNTLFHEALEREPADRDAFLRGATTEEDVRREVAALIAAHVSDSAFLESPAVDATKAAGVEHGASAPGETPTRVGRSIGPYLVSREIARGGMGVVYHAHDLRLGRDVAIKALPPELARDAGRRERLRREARSAAALAHPGIATIHALEEDGDELFLVSEYISGATLRETLADGPLAVDRLLRVALQLAEATAAAHAIGIVHRDLKPENVICTESGGIKILDFGLARGSEPWAHAIAPTLTAEGMLVGTPAYMSPEQIRGAAVDARTDVFALGVVLYELTAGRHPFGTGSVGDVLHQVLTVQPPPIVRPDVPPSLLDVIARCLAKDPDDRPANAGEVAAALAALMAERSGLGSGARPVPPAPDRAAPAAAAGPATTSSRLSGSPLWWWAFHQAAVAAFQAAIVVPVWLAWRFVEHPQWRLTLRVLLLVAVAIGVSVRLHLRFMARVHPGAVHTQRARSRTWIRVSDWGLVAVLLGGAVSIFEVQAIAGSVLLGLAVCYTVVCRLIEPATAQAAFGDEA